MPSKKHSYPTGEQGWCAFIEAQDGLWYFRHGEDIYFNNALAREFQLRQQVLPFGVFVRLIHPDDICRALDVIEKRNIFGSTDIRSDAVRWQVAPSEFLEFFWASRWIRGEDVVVGHAVKRAEGKPDLSAVDKFLIIGPKKPRNGLVAVSLVAAAALINSLLDGFVFGIEHDALLFMAAVVTAAMVTNRRTAALVSSLSGLVWAFCFMPPPFTMWITRWQDCIIFAAFQLAALGLLLRKRPAK